MHTERLSIEPLSVDHAAGLFVALDDERVGRYIGGPDVDSVEGVAARIERVDTGPGPGHDEQWLNWAVLLEGTVIGRVEATLRSVGCGTRMAEIAYIFGPRWWGHGYATEATLWMIAHLRLAHGTQQSWATVDPANMASIGLLLRLGFDPTQPPDFGLGSFDAGDLVFVRHHSGRDESNALVQE